jgi:hypothetical protein
MTSTSAGSQPEGKEFLDKFIKGELLAQQKEREIDELIRARVPGVGDQALLGAVPNNMQEAAASGRIRI